MGVGRLKIAQKVISPISQIELNDQKAPVDVLDSRLDALTCSVETCPSLHQQCLMLQAGRPHHGGALMILLQGAEDDLMFVGVG